MPGKVLLYYLWHVFGAYAGVPEVVGEHEDDRTLLVAAGASVTQNRRRRKSQTDYLFPEPLEEFATALGPAPALPGRGADEDLSQLIHDHILFRASPCKELRVCSFGYLRCTWLGHLVGCSLQRGSPRAFVGGLLASEEEYLDESGFAHVREGKGKTQKGWIENLKCQED